MTAQILTGKPIADAIKADVKQRVIDRVAAGKTTPGLHVILVGNNPASASYVGHKQKACEAAGIQSHIHRLPENAAQADIAGVIEECNHNPDVHGILLQLPLPGDMPADNLLERIDYKKDVDGFHPYNLGRLAQRRPTLRPCTPYGITKMLAATNIEIAGKHAVIVGASNIVGRPMALEMLLQKCTVTVCHKFTQDLSKHVRDADILIVAIGKPGIIQADWIKPGCVVIDVGFNHLEDGTVCGDVPFEQAKEQASWITPVPGGVGLLTVATLLENTLYAAQWQDS